VALPLDAINVGIKANQGESRGAVINCCFPGSSHPRDAVRTFILMAFSLDGAEADSEQAAQQAARLMAHALDPCVAYRVQVIHA
jgi:hypothetical protein